MESNLLFPVTRVPAAVSPEEQARLLGLLAVDSTLEAAKTKKCTLSTAAVVSVPSPLEKCDQGHGPRETTGLCGQAELGPHHCAYRHFDEI